MQNKVFIFKLTKYRYNKYAQDYLLKKNIEKIYDRKAQFTWKSENENKNLLEKAKMKMINLLEVKIERKTC